MTVTFPNLGNVSVLLAVLMREWGIPFVMPLPTTQRTVELGAAYAPVGMCLPMKVVLGNLLESMERGADTGIFLGGTGPCLFGCFGRTCELVFKNNAFNFGMYIIETDAEGFRTAARDISRVTGKSYGALAAVVPEALMCVRLLDRYEQALYDIRATLEGQKEKKELTVLEKRGAELLKNAKSFGELKKTLRKLTRAVYARRGNVTPNKRIGIVGDIYTTIDAAVNGELQRSLSDMGFLTKRSMTVSGWMTGLLPHKKLLVRAAAHRYMPRPIGGFALETVSSAARYAKKADGIIEVYPLNCMPEVIADGVLGGIRDELNVPVMTLVLDELSSTGGYRTRLEAFADMIVRRRENELLARG